MKTNNAVIRIKIGLALTVCLAWLGHCHAQVLLSGGTYTQNFDSLPATTGNNTWANNITLLGWYANSLSNTPPMIFGASGNNAATNLIANAGTSTTGALYSFGTNGVNPATDRALGSVGANAMAVTGGSRAAIAYGVRLKNDTGYALTNFVVSYTGEQWRNAGVSPSVVHSLYFAYRVDSLPITDADPINSATWTPALALQFNSPTTNGTSAYALDGNSATNRTSISATIGGIMVLAGQEVFFRWGDLNEAGNDHALAIDDVSISFSTNFTDGTSAPIPDPVLLNRTVSGFNLILTWSDSAFTLCYGTNVSAVTNRLIGQTSPYTNAITGPEKYFRLVWP